jgi:FMN-dependent NADH-azoreductase
MAMDRYGDQHSRRNAMNVLQIDSSPLGAASASRQLTAAIVDGLRRTSPELTLVHRDLDLTAPSHLSGALLAALRGGSTTPDAELQNEIAFSDELLEEFLAADIIVIGAPMYNFSIPTQLKAWIDRIARAGRTFRYTEQEPVGLATKGRAIIASTRGSILAGDAPHADDWRHALDFQEDYLRRVLNFLGMTQVEIIRAEGLGLSPASRDQSLAAAQARIAETFAPALG